MRCLKHYLDKINQQHRASSLFPEKPTIDFYPLFGTRPPAEPEAVKAGDGYILHLDGTCEADSPQLFIGIDGIAHIVLDNIKLPSEKAELLIPFLCRIKRQCGDTIALVHDMGHILAYPADEYLDGLSDRTREDAKRPIVKQARSIQLCFS